MYYIVCSPYDATARPDATALAQILPEPCHYKHSGRQLHVNVLSIDGVAVKVQPLLPKRCSQLADANQYNRHGYHSMMQVHSTVQIAAYGPYGMGHTWAISRAGLEQLYMLATIRIQHCLPCCAAQRFS